MSTPDRREHGVVGVGASAGGLVALEAFFAALSPEAASAHAFVVVQHLAPDHESLLPELLRRVAHVEVVAASAGEALQAGRVYVVPPGVTPFVEGDALRWVERDRRDGIGPIDSLFESMARIHGPHAVGVVLSGTGRDGTAGLSAIAAAGGTTMAQAPDTAEFQGMPSSAIATGDVDYVLPPAGLAGRVNERSALPAEGARSNESLLSAILSELEKRTGHDLSGYKTSTLQRRLRRRMAVRSAANLPAYLTMLERDEDEAKALLDDMLIGVTRFFRDPDCFEALRAEALPRLVAALPRGTPLRAWVAGCSTGEEAYSLAILLSEWATSEGVALDYQVFATDLDPNAVAIARAGVYPASIAEDVSTSRLARFFTARAESDTFRIGSQIREKVIFSVHDVLRDPPFSRLDLVSCRNLLIYLDAASQRRVIPMFHYALNPGGVLLLGPSETIGPHDHLFSTINHRARLYAQHPRHAGGRPALQSSSARRFAARIPTAVAEVESPQASPRQLTERGLLEHGRAVALLVDAQGEILYLHGRAGLYFEPSPGEGATRNAFEMAHEGLRHELAGAVYRVIDEGAPVSVQGLRLETHGRTTSMNLEARPVAREKLSHEHPVALVVLEPTSRVAAPKEAGVAVEADERSALTALRRELAAKDEYIRRTQRAARSTQEALQSSNEELQSVNEELQSTNEELETSKEELQSVNEELATVNAELHANVTELTRTNNDLSNLLAGTDIGTLFLDHALTIQRFTPAVREIVPVIESDLGRPIAQITSNLIDYASLVEDTRGVLETLVPKEVEVQSVSERWYLLRIRPYRTLENLIEGAVITFTDITEVKTAREMMRESEALRRLAAVLRDAHDAVLVLGLEGRIEAWNPGAERLYGWTEEEAVGMHIRDMIPNGNWQTELTRMMSSTQSSPLAPFRATRLRRDGSVVEVSLSATALAEDGRGVYGISTTERRLGGAGDGGDE